MDWETKYLYSKLVARMDMVPPAKRNAETMAKAAYEGLRCFCDEVGMNPDTECMIRAPGEEAYDGNGKGRWLVALEAGPFEWAIPISMELPYGLTEPYFSFDLSFYEAETYS